MSGQAVHQVEPHASSGTDPIQSVAPDVVDRRRHRWSSRVALTCLLGLAAVFYSWNIGSSGLSTYYAAAAKSMATGPRALLFGALDPAGTVTLDKLSGFLVPQTLSVALFGFHAWALSLPQAVEGLVTVFVGYLIGRRWRGNGYGLAIAGLLTITPMLAAMFGRPMEDGMVTMCQVLAFAALQRALQSQHLRWLLLSGAWVAVGFQAKMMQSWLFLPALVLAYLVGSELTLRRRILHIAIACSACLLLSVAWMTAIQLVPTSARPFIDGSTSNNIFATVFGYNGFDRLLSGIVPGAVPQLTAHTAAGHALVNHTRTAVAGASVAKLLLPQFTTQIGWLYPAAVAGIGFAAAEVVRGVRRARLASTRPSGDASRTERIAAGTEIGLATWLVTVVGVLSLAFVPHATYFAVISLPLAAFAVHGAARSLAAYRTSRWWPILPALIAVQGLWAASIVVRTPPQLHPLVPVILATTAISAATLVLAHAGRRALITRVGLIAGLIAALIAPTAWSSFTIASGGGGSASDAFAGPRIGADGSVPLIATGHRVALMHLHHPFAVPYATALSPEDRRLLQYVDVRNSRDAIPFASDSLPVVVSVILGSRASPLPMGGFSQQAPEPSVSALISSIAEHRLRFVLLQQTDWRAPLPSNPVLELDRSWVGQHCVPVLSGRFRDRSAQRQTLYDCGVVPAA